jgi:aerobic-type carbon monoxide dehydrogenase small subunit (CoxS/CutS family)
MTVPALDITTTVDGEVVRLRLAPEVLLLDMLRDELGLLGAKRSCDVEVCGACTVLLDGLPVSACTTLAWQARGRTILTIEGVAGAAGLHPLQQAFLAHGALQCGFCTPGMILAAKALLDVDPAPSVEAIRHHMRGNICRCGGYPNIVGAIQAAATMLRAESR